MSSSYVIEVSDSPPQLGNAMLINTTLAARAARLESFVVPSKNRAERRGDGHKLKQSFGI
jgi:hypothetical protein